MDLYDHYRARLQELVDRCSGGKHAHFAALIDKDPSYVSRLLYPAGKKGAKRLGVDMMAHIRDKLSLEAGWFDLPTGSNLPTPKQNEFQLPIVSLNTGSPGPKYLSWPWPFERVSPADWDKLSNAQKLHIEAGIKLMLGTTQQTNNRPSTSARVIQFPRKKHPLTPLAQQRLFEDDTG